MSRDLIYNIVHVARQRIEDRADWVRGEEAVARITGKPVNPLSKGARRFCATGALERTVFDLVGDTDKAKRMVAIACEELNHKPPIRAADAVDAVQIINDRRGHAAVLRLFDAYLAKH